MRFWASTVSSQSCPICQQLDLSPFLPRPEPPPVSLARGPPTDWAELVQTHDNRDIIQVSPDELPVIDICSL